MDWINIECLNDTHIGFIYKITNTITNQFYIGKKNLQSYKTIKSTYKNGNPRKVKEWKESNWKCYYSSSKIVKAMNKSILKREILFGCKTASELSFEETKLIINNWNDPLILNGNIKISLIRR